MNSLIRSIILIFALMVSAMGGRPKPEHYFNDYVGIVSTDTAQGQEERLVALEKRTGIEFVVAIFDRFDSEDDYILHCQEVAESWGIGKKQKDNGVVMFVFMHDRENKIRTVIVTGYGMEEHIPDATAKTIIDQEIRPHIRAAKAATGAERQAEFNAAIVGGINGVISAINHSYVPTVAPNTSGTGISPGFVVIIIVLIILLVIVAVACDSTSSMSRSSYSSGSSSGSSGSSSDSSWGGGSFGGGGATGAD